MLFHTALLIKFFEVSKKLIPARQRKTKAEFHAACLNFNPAFLRLPFIRNSLKG
jgi:hypothetical protein